MRKHLLILIIVLPLTGSAQPVQFTKDSIPMVDGEIVFHSDFEADLSKAEFHQRAHAYLNEVLDPYSGIFFVDNDDRTACRVIDYIDIGGGAFQSLGMYMTFHLQLTYAHGSCTMVIRDITYMEKRYFEVQEASSRKLSMPEYTDEEVMLDKKYRVLMKKGASEKVTMASLDRINEIVIGLSASFSGKRETDLDYTIKLDVISEGYDGETNWFHPHAGTIPGKKPVIVLTMQKWLLSRSDVFFAIAQTRSMDLGKTWTDPEEQTETLGRRPAAGQEVGISDFTPKWHAGSGKLLGTGHMVHYRDNHLVSGLRRSTVWSVYDEEKHRWSAWDTLDTPDLPVFYNEGAGSTQRVDLPNGDILLPVYTKEKDADVYAATVLRCSFNGEKLEYLEHGDILRYPAGRGFPEPSLTFFKNRFYLTLRNDDSAYVAMSDDGFHFSIPETWKFDDGEDLGSYNTQQHWVAHSDGLFLVYTRKGADNDNVVRHRAPLFIARVDPDKLVIIRSSERVLVPNKGAQLGNFGVTNVSENETWITTSEGMSEADPTKYGANGRVYAARIIWKKPNRMWNKY